jgi:hypothetical protein
VGGAGPGWIAENPRLEASGIAVARDRGKHMWAALVLFGIEKPDARSFAVPLIPAVTGGQLIEVHPAAVEFVDCPAVEGLRQLLLPDGRVWSRLRPTFVQPDRRFLAPDDEVKAFVRETWCRECRQPRIT